jgi:Patatin-like phospholipase
MWIVGISLLRARRTYEYNPPELLLALGLIAIASGFLLWGIFYGRRIVLKRYEKTTSQAPTEQSFAFPHERKFSKVTEMPFTHWILVVAGAVSLILLALFTFDPVRFAGNLGTGAVLALAGASWILWGSALAYWGGRYQLPVLTLIAIFVALCSLTNDNHDIRTVFLGQMYKRYNVEHALRDWHNRIRANSTYVSRPKHPLFIVAAEGGGIRAAYWTAAVLGSIQDAEPAFVDHVFAISGVSGGSLGAAVFDALVADGNWQGQFAKRSETMLGQDFLSPAIAAMLYPDFIQRFWPWPFTYLDRGHWLEESWERAWRYATGKSESTDNRFAEPFFSLWKSHQRYVPALFLNATSVENGNRVIASNIQISADPDQKEEFLGAEDLVDKIKPAVDMPLSTAAHLSARFTYVSPAARFKSDGTHAVDGGYFENSGATTALDILRQVNVILNNANTKAEFADVVPKIIMISNSPVGTGFGDRKSKDFSKEQGPTIAREISHYKPGSFLEDAVAPAYALLHTREARGVYAQRAIGKAQQIFYAERDLPEDPNAQVYFFSLAQTTVPLPLGWMLSNRAAEAIQHELYDLKSSPHGLVPIVDAYNNRLTSNTEMREAIITAVHGQKQ